VGPPHRGGKIIKGPPFSTSTGRIQGSSSNQIHIEEIRRCRSGGGYAAFERRGEEKKGKKGKRRGRCGEFSGPDLLIRAPRPVARGAGLLGSRSRLRGAGTAGGLRYVS